MLKVIQSKALRGTHLLVALKEIQARYLTSPYFRDIYPYLAQNKLPSTKMAIQRVEALAEKYILLDSLLFKIITTQKRKQHCWVYQKIVQTKLLPYIMQVCLQDIKSLLKHTLQSTISFSFQIWYTI